MVPVDKGVLIPVDVASENEELPVQGIGEVVAPGIVGVA